MALTRRDGEYVILAAGKSLMSSRMHGSEEALAAFACRDVRTLERPCVLVGGLGMGFTLRATLDLLPKEATVVVAELVPAVVEWNRGPLGPLAGHPLKDKRVSGRRGRRRGHAAREPQSLRRRDARRRQRAGCLYRIGQRTGSMTIAGWRPRARALKRGGVLAVWSASRESTLRAAPALRKIRRRSRARSRPPEKGRPAPHHLSGSQARGVNWRQHAS